MATLPLVSPPALPLVAVPGDLAREHWRERLLRGYLAIKSLCLRLGLPHEGEFFDKCGGEFAQAYRLADKGTRTRNVDLLAAVIIYRQALAASIPVPKSTLIASLGERKSLSAFHRVLVATSKNAPRQDPRIVVSRLIGAMLGGISAPGDVVEVASRVVTQHLDTFLLTKPRVGAAAIVTAAVLATEHTASIHLTQIAAFAKVAPSAVDRCLTAAAARLGKPLTDVPSKCGSIFRELFAAGIASPPA